MNEAVDRTIVLVHSPLVGPGTWRKLAPELEARGQCVIVPDLQPAFQASPPFYPALVTRVTQALPKEARLLLVVHSGAGALLPAIAVENPQVEAAIFLDALLPHPGRPWFDTAPPPLARHLLSLVQAGRLPPWHRWWPDGAIETLLGDRNDYAAFAAELIDVPIDYFEEPAPLSSMPQGVDCFYLQLSEACREDADEALHKGWAVERLEANHLAMLTEPERIATAMLSLGSR